MMMLLKSRWLRLLTIIYYYYHYNILAQVITLCRRHDRCVSVYFALSDCLHLAWSVCLFVPSTWLDYVTITHIYNKWCGLDLPLVIRMLSLICLLSGSFWFWFLSLNLNLSLSKMRGKSTLHSRTQFGIINELVQQTVSTTETTSLMSV